MNIHRVIWSVLNVPAMLFFSLVGALADLITWEWLADRCDRWITETQGTRP